MNGADVEATVRWLRDRELAKEVPMKYARAIDELDWDALLTCFHPDARWSGALGEGDYLDYLRNVYDKSEPYATRMHLMGNQYVDVDPGADRARVATYTVSWNMETPGNGRADLLMGVRYDDELVRGDETWVIERRHAATQWVRGPFPRPD